MCKIHNNIATHACTDLAFMYACNNMANIYLNMFSLMLSCVGQLLKNNQCVDTIDGLEA